jgi:hypothetical protein
MLMPHFCFAVSLMSLQLMVSTADGVAPECQVKRWVLLYVL